VTTNDVLLASASNAIILGFHVALDGSAASLGKREGVEIRLYQIIYELVDDVRDAMTGLLAPEERERVVGQAQIRQVFELSNRNRVAGCMITKGRISSRARARVRRGSDVLYEGRLETLKRFQNDAREVREGQECGLRLDGFSNFEVGDIVETYEIEQMAAQL
jgi:translation initiation factor IF-2